MRRHSIAGGAPAGAVPILRLDPGALPVRYQTRLAGTASEAPAAIVLDRRQALVRQMRDGVPTVLTLPIATFRGIAARFEPLQGGMIRTVLELAHDDPALSLPLAIAIGSGDLADDWEAWGRVFGLPLLLPDSAGTLRTLPADPATHPLDKPRPRRRRGFMRHRRPRFARRRKTGRAPADRIAGREITARN